MVCSVFSIRPRSNVDVLFSRALDKLQGSGCSFFIAASSDSVGLVRVVIICDRLISPYAFTRDICDEEFELRADNSHAEMSNDTNQLENITLAFCETNEYCGIKMYYSNQPADLDVEDPFVEETPPVSPSYPIQPFVYKF
jgi:hypothetical protein